MARRRALDGDPVDDVGTAYQPGPGAGEPVHGVGDLHGGRLDLVVSAVDADDPDAIARADIIVRHRDHQRVVGPRGGVRARGRARGGARPDGLGRGVHDDRLHRRAVRSRGGPADRHSDGLVLRRVHDEVALDVVRLAADGDEAGAELVVGEGGVVQVVLRDVDKVEGSDLLDAVLGDVGGGDAEVVLRGLLESAGEHRHHGGEDDARQRTVTKSSIMLKPAERACLRVVMPRLRVARAVALWMSAEPPQT